MTELLDVSLERDDEGVLVVRWSHRTGAGVDVAIGPSPDATGHRRIATSADTGALRLDEPAGGRLYASLSASDGAPLVVAERRVPFVGITNVRDLGGYPTVGGGRTRWGLVYRADALHKLTEADRVAFAALGVRTVYDLRGDVERDEFPGPFPSLHVPISGRPPGAVMPPPPPDMTTAHGEDMLRDTYVGALEHSATNVGTVLRGLADPASVPAVFHCHGGKDRTGVVAAVLLLALGVDRETVLDDYEATRRYRIAADQHDSLANLLAAGVSPEAAAGVLGTPRWAMAAAVDAVDERYGGIEAFVTGPAGLSSDELAALRHQLT